MSDWKPINSAPRTPVQHSGDLAWGAWVRLRNAEREEVGRWREAVDGYDISTDKAHHVPARWEDAEDRPLDFEPTEWAPHSSGLPRR